MMINRRAVSKGNDHDNVCIFHGLYIIKRNIAGPPVVLKQSDLPHGGSQGSSVAHSSSRVSAAASSLQHEKLSQLAPLLQLGEHVDVLPVLVRAAPLAQLIGKVGVDAALGEHVHEEIVEVAVQDVPRHRVAGVRVVVALEHCDLVNCKYI